MPKQPTAGGGSASTTNKSRPHKTIQKTHELLRHHEKNGKGSKCKEKQVDAHPLVSEAKSSPSSLSVERFAKIRSLEILAFQNAIKSAALQGSTRVFQSLPRHLRRRAASHNPRRVPKRYRSRAAAEIDPGDRIAKIHRKRAKIRAGGNLRGQSRTEQLLSRQRDKTWLPTHIYHAKRFRMVNLWSHRLPLTPTLKSFRPAYRASRRKAIVHDASYFGTIELEGSRSELILLLGRMIGGTFAGPKYESGARMVQTTIYHYDMFPLGLIGPVSLLWAPDGSRVWLRLHPSIFTEAWDALKLAISRIASSSTGLLIKDLRQELSSFEVVGPQGGKLLRRILRQCRSEMGVKQKFFSSLGDSSYVAVGTVAGISVYDPRLHFPPPALKDDETNLGDDEIQRLNEIHPSSELATSTIWDGDVRENTSVPTYKKFDLDHRRQKLPLPGTRLRPTSHDDRFPLLIIATGQSYTIIFPRGWSPAILHSAVYTATLLAGLNERRAQHREAGVPCFPEHFGNICESGKEWENQVASETHRRWGRKPPGKRLEDPTWKPDWEHMLGLSEEEGVNGIQPWLFPSFLHDFIDRPEKAIDAYRRERKMTPLAPGFSKSAVVHVKVDSIGRGSPGDMAAVYQLDSQERSAWLNAVQTDEGAERINDEPSEAQQLGEVPTNDSALIGYTTTGNFSLSRGKGHALGTVTLTAWNELSVMAEDGRVVVKFKNNGGRLCRLAKLSLV